MLMFKAKNFSNLKQLPLDHVDMTRWGFCQHWQKKKKNLERNQCKIAFKLCFAIELKEIYLYQFSKVSANIFLKII